MKHARQSAIAALRAAEWMPMTAVRVLIGIFFCSIDGLIARRAGVIGAERSHEGAE
jgi:hypothetical protein